jgi:hypothetical protein
MGVVVVPIVLVLLVLAAGAWMLMRVAGGSSEKHEEVTGSEHRLRYDVPHGQDPVAVAVALESAGFPSTHETGNLQRLVVMLPLGEQQREEVRVVLENEAAQTLDGEDPHLATGPVVFVGE